MTTRVAFVRLLLRGLLFVVSSVAALSQNLTFTPIGPATSRSIVPRGISSNGKIVVGDIVLDDGLTHPFIWDQGVFTLIQPGMGGSATGVSADGSKVAVTLTAPSWADVPCLWTAAGLESLPLFPVSDWQSFTTGHISSDGSTVIGNGVLGNRVLAVKWTPAGIEEIVGALPASDVSADGAVIVGDRALPNGPPIDPYANLREAFRWTASSGLVGLGSIEGDSQGWLVSGDGTIVQGNYGSLMFGSKLLFRWTEMTGMEAFDSRNQYNVPTAISFDGKVVLSTSSYGDGYPKDAVIWTAAEGSALLRDYARAKLRYDLVQYRELYYWRFREARALSPGGRFIAGYGDNPDGLQQMFLIDLGPLPPPQIASATQANAVFDAPFRYTITASNDPESFGADFISLGGLSINPSNGIISGSPSAAGTFEIYLYASNAAGTDMRVLTLNVAKATAGITISNTIQAYTGAPRPVSVSTVPAGLATSVTYAGSSAPPTSPGTYQVDAVIVDPNYQGATSGSLTITPPPVPVISSSTTATSTYHAVFNYTITASNGPQSFDATGLPAGLSVDQSTGVISGQPAATGTFLVTLKATNPGGDGTAVLTLQVGKAIAGVTISDTNQVYTGAPRAVSVTTNPVGLTAKVTYNGTEIAPSAIGTYQVSASITDPNYDGSATATLNIYSATLQILTQPTSVTVTEGSSASFSVKASGPGTLTYAWRKGSGSNTPVIGTSATYTIPSTTLADAGTYKVTVSNGSSSVTSVAAKLTVNSVPVVIAPTITQQPLSQTVTLTNAKKSVSATFSVSATGTAPLSYQWTRNGVPISSATGNSYTISKVAPADNGSQFQVTVSNAAGSVVSNVATLTVR